jgi:glucosamine--fructose-6-phosphate aminotransferase (isomerizing)
MCAIFGYIARKNKPVSLEVLARIIRANIARGPHSFGFSWIDADGRLHCFKQKGRLTDQLGTLALARGARAFVGHLRFATHGDADQNINNHPHPSDGGWIVHNGIVSNYRSIMQRWRLAPVSECDSEALGLMIEQGSGSLLARAAEAIDSSSGGLTLMGLWARPMNLIVARRGNPLHVTDSPDGLYLASLAMGLPGKVWQIKDNTARQISHKDKALKYRVKRLAKSSERVACGLFDDDGEYRGG